VKLIKINLDKFAFIVLLYRDVMIVNTLLLLATTIYLISAFILPNVSATPSTVDNITSDYETNLTNSAIPFLLTEGNNHTSINETELFEYLEKADVFRENKYIEGLVSEDFSFENRIIPKK
jgi:uncharacterized membrane protein affecting hemolysin expression